MTILSNSLQAKYDLKNNLIEFMKQNFANYKLIQKIDKKFKHVTNFLWLKVL